mmetsp:Transcript_20522/g.36886  ORF Transcript_20522/g.36886 Transcript_20522/m.36886 type:complete len:225 (-) Transcript_20522:164-838(-)
MVQKVRQAAQKPPAHSHQSKLEPAGSSGATVPLHLHQRGSTAGACQKLVRKKALLKMPRPCLLPLGPSAEPLQQEADSPTPIASSRPASGNLQDAAAVLGMFHQVGQWAKLAVHRVSMLEKIATSPMCVVPSQPTVAPLSCSPQQQHRQRCRALLPSRSSALRVLGLNWRPPWAGLPGQASCHQLLLHHPLQRPKRPQEQQPWRLQRLVAKALKTWSQVHQVGP